MSSTSETCRHIFEDIHELLNKHICKGLVSDACNPVMFRFIRYVAHDKIYEPVYQATNVIRRNLINKNKEYEFENSVN
jgi:hypothetical protein